MVGLLVNESDLNRGMIATAETKKKGMVFNKVNIFCLEIIGLVKTIPPARAKKIIPPIIA